jgi:hypothetical protein
MFKPFRELLIVEIHEYFKSTETSEGLMHSTMTQMNFLLVFLSVFLALP